MKTLLIFTLIVFSTLQQGERDSNIIVSPSLFPDNTPQPPTVEPSGIPTSTTFTNLDFVLPSFSPGDASLKTIDPILSPVIPSTHDEIVKARTARDGDLVTLAYSGDGKSSQVISSSADSRTVLPFALPTKTKATLPKADLKTVSANPMPWIPNASLVTPGNTAVIMNMGIIVIYEITFYNDCPQNTVLMHLHVWDNFLIYDPATGQQVYPTPGTWGNPICNLIKLPAKCGCNKLWIVLYNWQNPSFYGIWYELYQSQTNCYNCPENPSDSFYNRTSCKCECAYECKDCAVYSKIWVNYPTCGCRCRISMVCFPPKYFNARTCSCVCPPVCCLKGWYQDEKTCACVSGFVVLPPILTTTKGQV